MRNGDGKARRSSYIVQPRFKGKLTTVYDKHPADEHERRTTKICCEVRDCLSLMININRHKALSKRTCSKVCGVCGKLFHLINHSRFMNYFFAGSPRHFASCFCLWNQITSWKLQACIFHAYFELQKIFAIFQENSHFAEAFYRRGLCKLKLGMANGIQDLNRALALNPNLFEAYLSRAAYYSTKNRFSKVLLHMLNIVSLLVLVFVEKYWWWLQRIEKLDT